MSARPRLIAGRPAALEAAFVAEARRGLPLPPILIGHRLLRPALRRLLGRAGGFLGGVIVTPEELAWRLHPPVAKEPLGRAALRVVAEEAAATGPLGDPEAPGYFSPVSATPGFVEALGRLLGELRRSGISPEALAEPVEGVDTAKLAHLAGMQADFRARSGDRPLTDELFFDADPQRLRASRLLIFGVWSLDQAERTLLDRLVGAGVEVVIFLPDPVDPALRTVTGWVAGHDGSIELVADEPADAGSALGLLQARLFTNANEPVPEDESVLLVSAPDPVREVREAARACLRWARQGIPFCEMAVVYRAAQPYRALVEEVFLAAGIPVYLHDGRPLALHPTGRRVLALLDLLGAGLGRAAVMSFLAEAVLPSDAGEIEPAAWDALSKRAGIVGGQAEWRGRLARLRDEIATYHADHPDLVRIDALAAFVVTLGQRLEVVPPRASWRTYVARFGELLGWYVAASAPVVMRLAALADLDELTGEISLERFQAAVRSLVGALDLDDIAPDGLGGVFGRKGVAVLDVYSLRGLRFSAVAILGLAERQFPAAAGQDALLLDDERQALNAAHGWSLPLRSLEPSREPLQFAEAVRSADRALQLSFARTSGSSVQPALPSSFFRAAAEALIGRAAPARTVDSLECFFVRVPASRFGAGDPAAALDGGEYDRSLLERDPLLAAALVWPSYPRARAAWQARWADQELTPFDGIVSSVPPVDLTPTKLERYAICPYQFFAINVLRAAAEDEPELIERISAMDRGSVVHAILERFYREPPQTLERLLAIAGEDLDVFAQTGRAGRRLLWEIDRRQVLEDLQDWWSHAAEPGDFTPVKFETRFAERAYIRRSGGELVRFAGVIDRIDTAPDGRFRVIDYKTGLLDDKDNHLKGGRSLQLVFYLEAAADLLGQPVSAGEARYETVSRRGGFKQAKVDGALDRSAFETLLEGLVTSIGEGDFHPEPEGATCRRCAVRAVCDERIATIMERKAGDERMGRVQRRREG